MNETIGFLIDNLFRDKTVKSAMSVLGKKSGEVRSLEAASNTAAEQILTGPKMAGIKMGLGALGIDLDDMIDKHGPVGALAGLTQLGSLIGIDVTKLISDGLEGLGSGLMGGGGSGSSGENPHL